jgi:hypothetical protein
MCVLCRENETDSAHELCPLCEAGLRLEVAEGLYRLSRYLGAWAEFDEWLRTRRRAQVPTT